MFNSNDITCVRKDIARFIGSKVKLESAKGRQKSVVNRGTIEKVYPSIFTILLDELPQRTISYSYTDVLTNSVSIELCE